MALRLTNEKLEAETGLSKSSAVQVLALTKYVRLAASSRYRFLNYIPLLRARDVSVKVSPLLSETYIRRRLAGARNHYLELAGSYSSRLSEIIGARRFDVLWIEGELLPRFPATIERLLALLDQPFVIDLDDAIFHSYDNHPNLLVRKLLGHKIDTILHHATAVVVGNDYLAERARQAGSRHVVIVPTTVDHRAYAERQPLARDKLTFGWIGSSATLQYLQELAPQLEEFFSSRSARLRLIGVKQNDFNCPDVVLTDWSEDTELEALACCDIGLAPLSDGPWERGKCGLKAVQYMAMGIPVLAAQVGVLPTIVQHGKTGFIYRDSSEFVRYALMLAEDPELRQRMGLAGRERIAACYSIDGWVDTIADVLVGATSRRV